jgi:5-formyltetrahydrofolate cyclo-ligase
MTTDHQTGQEMIFAQKRQLRADALSRRRSQDAKRQRSEQIQHRLTARHDYRQAETISVYVSTATEVQTRDLITRAWGDRKRVAVPCCVDDDLQLFHLRSMEDLAPGALGILEPRAELRARDGGWVDVSEVDLFIVPGVAFDRNGGRLGLGKGYYDRLLAGVVPDVPQIALAFECQMICQVPMGPGDIAMDAVITERNVYCRDAESG